MQLFFLSHLYLNTSVVFSVSRLAPCALVPRPRTRGVRRCSRLPGGGAVGVRPRPLRRGPGNAPGTCVPRGLRVLQRGVTTQAPSGSPRFLKGNTRDFRTYVSQSRGGKVLTTGTAGDATGFTVTQPRKTGAGGRASAPCAARPAPTHTNCC